MHLFGGRPHFADETGPLRFKARPRVLSLLAYLLVNRSVSLNRDSVAYALWPDESEVDARSNLRRHLFYLLNDVLPAVGDEPWVLVDKQTVRWNPIAPAWCDVKEFERLGSDPASKAEAVALYRGDLLAGVDEEWLFEPRERLRERQIALLLGLIADSRTCGDFGAGIAHAKQLLAVDPWREDAIRALIAFRNAAGDRGGALQTYRDFAKRLDEDLGVAPMPETMALCERVAAETEVVSKSVIRAVPPVGKFEAVRPTPSFTGRESELAALDVSLWNGSRIAVVHGMGGIGKSALAREYCRRNRDRYALVWLLHAQTETDIVDGLVQLGSRLLPGVEGTHDRRSTAEYVVSTLLGGFTKPVLLVFDNVEHEWLVRPWFPQAAAHVFITSRHPVWSSDVVAIGLETWHPDEAARYLRHESGRADLSDADTQAIAEALGGLPLAFAHAAAYLRDTRNVTARRYLQRINDHLAKAPKGAEYVRAVLATFREAIVQAEQESPGAASLLCLAAFFAPDAIPEELFRQSAEVYDERCRPVLPGTATALLDLRTTVADADRVDEALGALHRLSLVAYGETGTYTLHRLVQKAGRHLLGNDDAEWALSALAAIEAVFPVPEFANWPTCERLVPHARAVLAALPKDVSFSAAARLADRFGYYLRKRAAFGEAERVIRCGLTIAEASYGADHPGVATSLDNLAGLLRDTNRHASAEPLYRRALAICEAASGIDHRRVAKILNNLAILLHYSNRLEEAEPVFRRALSIDETSYGPDHPTVATRLNNVALLLQETNRLTEAEPMFRRALAIDEASGGPDHPDVAADLCNLAWLLSATDRLTEAEVLLKRAIEIREASYGPEHPSFAFALSDLAVLLHDSARFADAERVCRRALAICQTSFGSDHPVVAALFNNLAELLCDTDRPVDAEMLYRRALAIDEASYGPRHPNVARDLSNLAGLFYATDRFTEAEACIQRAVDIGEASYGTQHPRVGAMRFNLMLLSEAVANTAKHHAAYPRWRSLRRSPSRGLRE